MGVKLQPLALGERCSGTETIYTLYIESDLAFFYHHFHALPIVPGVSQIQWVMARVPSTYHSFAGINKLKFSRPIFPNMEILLRLNENPEKNAIDFRYYDRGGSFSSGQILFN